MFYDYYYLIPIIYSIIDCSKFQKARGIRLLQSSLLVNLDISFHACFL